MIRSPYLLSALLLAAATAPLAALSPALAAEDGVPASADAVAEAYAVLLARDYVYPETGARYAAAIRAAIKAGRYKALAGDALADPHRHDLTASDHLQSQSGCP